MHEKPLHESGRDANHRPYLDGSTQGRVDARPETYSRPCFKYGGTGTCPI